MNAVWIACDRGDYSDYDGECVVILGDDRRIAIVFDDDDALLIASAPILADEIAALKEQLAAAELARAVAEGNLELRSMSNEGLRQLIGEMVKGLELFRSRVEENGNWDDGCFYYRGTSASELQEPLTVVKGLIARARGAAS